MRCGVGGVVDRPSVRVCSAGGSSYASRAGGDRWALNRLLGSRPSQLSKAPSLIRFRLCCPGCPG